MQFSGLLGVRRAMLRRIVLKGFVMRMRNARTAFTLIELLVVVAIIAVLAAILLPSLSAAREQSKTVQCLSNTRQLARGFHTYANEYDGTLVPLRSLDKSKWWFHLLGESGCLPKGTGPENSTPAPSTIKDYYMGIWRCPSVVREEMLNNNWAAGSGWGGGYGVPEKSLILDYPANGDNGPPKLSRVQRQANIMMIADAGQGTGRGNYMTWIAVRGGVTNINRYNTGTNQPACRHSKDLANVAFVDGHAESWKYMDLRNDKDDLFAMKSSMEAFGKAYLP